MRALTLVWFFLLGGSFSSAAPKYLKGELSNNARLEPIKAPRLKANSLPVNRVVGPINPFPPIFALAYPSGLIARWTLNFDGRAGELNFSLNSFDNPTGTYRCDPYPNGPATPAISTTYYNLQSLTFYNSVTYNKNSAEWFVTFVVNDTAAKKLWTFYGQIDPDVANMHGQVYLSGEPNYSNTHIFHATKAIYATDNVIIRAGIPNGVLGNWAYLRLGTPGKLTLTAPSFLDAALTGTFMGLYGNVAYPPDSSQQWPVASSSRVILRYGSWFLYLLFWEPSGTTQRSQEFFILLSNDLTHGHGVNFVGGSLIGITFDLTKAGNTEAASPAAVVLGNWTFLVKGEPGTMNIQGLNSAGQLTIPGLQEYSPGTQLGSTNPPLSFTTYPMKNIYYTEWGVGWGVYFVQWQYHWSDQSADRFFDGILDYKRQSIYGCEVNYGVWSARVF